jgi:hypothetical protein
VRSLSLFLTKAPGGGNPEKRNERSSWKDNPLRRTLIGHHPEACGCGPRSSGISPGGSRCSPEDSGHSPGPPGSSPEGLGHSPGYPGYSPKDFEHSPGRPGSSPGDLGRSPGRPGRVPGAAGSAPNRPGHSPDRLRRIAQSAVAHSGLWICAVSCSWGSRPRLHAVAHSGLRY